VSHAAIAAALALTDVSAGERLTGLSLASFANREHRAWPGNRLAAARAGLSVRSFLTARAGLQRRGLLSLETPGGGRGNSAVIRLALAERGPWVHGEVNAERLEAVLGYSRASGTARALLAAIAAFSDAAGLLEGRSTEEICAAAGLSDRSYRRARAQLLDSGELQVQAGGGRGRMNRYRLADVETVYYRPLRAPATRPSPPAARPLVSSAHAHIKTAASDTLPRRTTTVQPSSVTYSAVRSRRANGPVLTGVSTRKGEALAGVSRSKGEVLTGVPERKDEASDGVCANPGQIRTVSSQTPAKTPAETPAPGARTGRESQNPQNTPPTPLKGGHAPAISIRENYRTNRGRRRQRTVEVNLTDAAGQLRPLGDEDHADWRGIRRELTHRLGDSTAAIWLESLSPAARAPDGTLLLACPEGTEGWITPRYGPLITDAARTTGRSVRLMTAAEAQLHAALLTHDSRHAAPSTCLDHKEAV
jgi:hypothetical protein